MKGKISKIHSLKHYDHDDFSLRKKKQEKTDFLWIFKWEMLTSFSQNNVTLHNFSVLIIIQVLAVQCKYDEDIFNFSLLKSDQLEGVF